MPFDLFGIPSDAEVWRVDGTHYVVYYVPNTDPPVPLVWKVPSSEDREALGITGVDRSITKDQLDRSGALFMGTTNEIPDPGQGAHPFDALVGQYETEVQVKPWLADPEILSLWAGAAIEGRSITPAELQTTDWWRTHSDTERRWISLNASDPATANQMISDNRLSYQRTMEQAGIDNASPELISLIADKVTTGEWSQAKAMTQIQGLADPSARVTIDPVLTDFQDGLDTTRGREEEVRALVNKWLGPSYASGWTDQNISEWAGQFRNNPDAKTELTETLRNQRLALFPEYENPNLTYEDIAAPWRGVFRQIWGQIPDETDSLFTRIVRLNDMEAASQILRQKGLEQGNRSVALDALSSLGQAFGGQIRRVGGFR